MYSRKSHDAKMVGKWFQAHTHEKLPWTWVTRHETIRRRAQPHMHYADNHTHCYTKDYIFSWPRDTDGMEFK